VWVYRAGNPFQACDGHCLLTEYKMHRFRMPRAAKRWRFLPVFPRALFWPVYTTVHAVM
jgi:hypothetical protein